MNGETAVVDFTAPKRNICCDLELPLNISANELVTALNTAFKLDIDTGNIKNCFLKAENPISLLKGNKTLKEFRIRNGSRISYTE